MLKAIGAKTYLPVSKSLNFVIDRPLKMKYNFANVMDGMDATDFRPLKMKYNFANVLH